MNESDIHKGHRQRVKERFLTEGLESFPLHNILEIVLFYSVPRVDVNVLAHRLERRFGSLRNILDAPYEDLLSVEGVTENTATLLKLIPAVCKQYMTERQNGEVFDTIEKVAEYFVAKYIGTSVETVYLLMLDNSRKMISCRKVFDGSINSSGVDVRKLAEIAITEHASTVVLAHNHPRGRAIPSTADKQMTEEIAFACHVLHIDLWNHIVVAGTDYALIIDESGRIPRD
ncbi:MAG: RadC family protein [Clostridia bacterium]|nr:RadC family protein [Clostridia bacterium]